jgi:hypothetical protein
MLPTLTYRLTKNAPLTPQEGDSNLQIVRDFVNGLESRMGVSLNADGSLKSPDAVAVKSLVGSGTAYVVSTTALVIASVADLEGVLIALWVDTANSGAATLVYNGASALPIKRYGGGDLEANDVKDGAWSLLTYNVSGFYELLSPTMPAKETVLDPGGTAVYSGNYIRTIPHTLGVVPSKVRVVLAATGAAPGNGYAQGDEIDVALLYVNANPRVGGVYYVVDSANVTCVIANGIAVRHKDDATLSDAIANSAWTFKCYLET